MANATPMPLAEQLCFALYSTSIAINRTYKPLLDNLGVTYPQYLVLSVLWEDDGQSISAIGQHLGLEPSTITPLVKRLEAAGLLDRARNPADERQLEVRLTKKGKDMQKKSGCLTATLLERSGLQPKDLIALNQQVLRLREGLTRGAEEAGQPSRSPQRPGAQ